MFAIPVGIGLVLAAFAVVLFGVLDTLPYVLGMVLLGFASIVFNVEAMRERNRQTYDSLDQLRRELYQAEKRQQDREKAANRANERS